MILTRRKSEVLLDADLGVRPDIVRGALVVNITLRVKPLVVPLGACYANKVQHKITCKKEVGRWR